jgi:hypothetical protein
VYVKEDTLDGWRACLVYTFPRQRAMSQYYLPTNGMQISQLRCYARWNAEKSQSLHDKLNNVGKRFNGKGGDPVLSDRDESIGTGTEREAIRRTTPVHNYIPPPPFFIFIDLCSVDTFYVTLNQDRLQTEILNILKKLNIEHIWRGCTPQCTYRNS